MCTFWMILGVEFDQGFLWVLKTLPRADGGNVDHEKFNENEVENNFDEHA